MCLYGVLTLPSLIYALDTISSNTSIDSIVYCCILRVVVSPSTFTCSMLYCTPLPSSRSSQCHNQSLLLSHTSDQSPVFISFDQVDCYFVRHSLQVIDNMSRMRWLPSILAFKTYYPDSPSFGIFDTSEMIIVLAPEHIKSSLYLVNPSTFNVSDWYASSSWPSYCWSLISSTSYSSTSPKVPFWCMNPYDMPTRLVEIKEVDVELHLIILYDSRCRYWSLSICHHRHPRSPVVVCTKILLLFFLLPLLPLPPVPLQRCC